VSEDEEMAALEPILDELQTASYNSIVQVINYLLEYYEVKLDSPYLAVNQTIITLCDIMGDLLVAIPEEDRDNIESKVRERISYRRTMTESEVTNSDEDSDPEDPMDLANMTPRGNC